MLPRGRGTLVVRTNFADQWAWDDLCELVRQRARDVRSAKVRLVDEPDYDGVTTEDLLDLLPAKSGYTHLAVADQLIWRQETAAREHNVLVVDLHRHREISRISAAAFAESLVSATPEEGSRGDRRGEVLPFRERRFPSRSVSPL
ncbi:DUF6924 domain-containing protein [Amycolatopsis thailandensis]|uniref:DUF6924 domain-containing protein n=1 Tax=Amycolatopsis thailandensis TaxID=589330 RepID=UPI00269A7C25